MSTQKSAHDAMLELMVALDFDEADLKANRDHYITKKQRNRLTENRRYWRNNRGCLPLVALLVLIVIIWNIIQQHGLCVEVLIPIIVFIAVIAQDNYSHEKQWEPKQDLNKGDVASVEGIPRLQRDWTKSGIIHNCWFAHQRFGINGAAYAALDGAGKCCAYFSPWSKTLLSMEILDGGTDRMPKIRHWKRQPAFNVMKWPGL